MRVDELISPADVILDVPALGQAERIANTRGPPRDTIESETRRPSRALY